MSEPIIILPLTIVVIVVSIPLSIKKLIHFRIKKNYAKDKNIEMRSIVI